MLNYMHSTSVANYKLTNSVHTPPAIQPTVHPVLIPQNQFCVMSLDPDTLPSIATTLIDVLFYSNR